MSQASVPVTPATSPKKVSVTALSMPSSLARRGWMAVWLTLSASMGGVPVWMGSMPERAGALQ